MEDMASRPRRCQQRYRKRDLADPLAAKVNVMVEFSDKFIGFVDVLGFKDLVTRAERGEGLPLSKILELVEFLGDGKERERFEKRGPSICPAARYEQRHLDFCVTQISDSAVVSAEVSPAGVINLLFHCWSSVTQLLQNGIMCRGYIKRGTIYHAGNHIVGTGYQEAYLSEGKVGAFKREADERGTPFVEIDCSVSEYVSACDDACVKEMYSRFVKTDGNATALFPFKRLEHSFIISGFGATFDAAKERASNNNVRTVIRNLKLAVNSHVDSANADAVRKANHYIEALNNQLAACDRTDEVIAMLASPFPAHRLNG